MTKTPAERKVEGERLIRTHWSGETQTSQGTYSIRVRKTVHPKRHLTDVVMSAVRMQSVGCWCSTHRLLFSFSFSPRIQPITRVGLLFPAVHLWKLKTCPEACLLEYSEFNQVNVKVSHHTLHLLQ